MNQRKHKILVSAPLHFWPDLKETIEKEMDLAYAYDPAHRDDKDYLETLLKKHSFEGWMVHPCPAYRVDKTLVDLCPSLKIVASPSTGSDHVDVDYILSKGIEFFCLKGCDMVDTIYASSEFTFSLMLATLRNIPSASRAAMEGQWRDLENQFRGRELNGLTLGIVGCGRIGGNLARYSLALGMKILTYDPYKKIAAPGITQVATLEELLPKADVLAACVHLNAETYKMINEDIFRKLKDGAYFVNTSRGDIVDQDALLRYLKSGKIRAAGLDVISGELTPESKGHHPLIQYAKTHDNLIITPHIAGLTYESEKKAQTRAYEAIQTFLKKSMKAPAAP